MESVKQKLSPQDILIEMTSLYIEEPQNTFCLDFLRREDLKKVPEGLKIAKGVWHFLK